MRKDHKKSEFEEINENYMRRKSNSKESKSITAGYLLRGGITLGDSRADSLEKPTSHKSSDKQSDEGRVLTKAGFLTLFGPGKSNRPPTAKLH